MTRTVTMSPETMSTVTSVERWGMPMEHKGTLSIIGDNTDPLPIRCVVTGHRVRITTPDGAEIADWGIHEIGIQRDGNSVTIRAEGETLKLDVDRPDALASALGLDESERLAERVAAAGRASSSTEGIHWRIVGAAVIAVVVIGLVVTAVLGFPPFNRDDSTETALNIPSTVAASSTTSPPTTSPPPSSTRPLTLQEQNLMLRDVWLAYTQENPAGIFGYWRRATEASGNGDWASMGAECKLGASTNQYWQTIIAAIGFHGLPAYSLLQAFADEADLVFFWCSGGDQYASEAAVSHQGVAYELALRINDTFGIEMQE
jgi:hypothetical protein